MIVPDIFAQKLRTVLMKCSSWLVDNILSLHLGMTESISLKLKHVTDLRILFDGHVIKSSDSVKYLRICIDKIHSCANIV